jgi:hypothetical protein
MKEKLTSRKLWVSIIGIISGIVLIVAGNTTEGAATLITSILGYLIAEGYIDAKAVDSVVEIVDDNLDEMVEE